MSPEVQGQLQGLISQLGQQGTALLQQVAEGLRQALSSAIAEVFLYGMAAVVIAFVINLFIREVPLRREYTLDEEHIPKTLE